MPYYSSNSTSSQRAGHANQGLMVKGEVTNGWLHTSDNRWLQIKDPKTGKPFLLSGAGREDRNDVGFSKDQAIKNSQKFLMLKDDPYVVTKDSYLPIWGTKEIEIGIRAGM